MYKAIRFRKALLGPELKPVDNVWMTIEGGLIAALGTGEGPAEVPRHPAAVAIPGLVDCHVHLALSGGADVEREARASHPDARQDLIEANAFSHLQSGVTTVRDLGSPEDAVLHAVKAGGLGTAQAPRIVAAGAISSPTGHGNFLSRWATTPGEYEEAIEAIAGLAAHWVKLFATGGVITTGTVPGATQMEPSLISNVAAAAHRSGLAVAAHAHGRDGIRNAIEAGVDSIEHFSYLTADEAALLNGSRCTLVSTLVATERFVSSDQRETANPEALAKILVHAPHERAALELAVTARLPLAVGTDAGTTFNPHGFGMQEQALHLNRAGMDPASVLRAMTVNGSRLLGGGAGYLDVGRPADVLCLDADPLEDLGALYQINEVIVGGRPVGT
ncbi:amidohydrolase family protein [Pseudarthrobacter sp. NamB4]|uniref:amidohydrolase family protein n=1 Tax=Pseudarthrobacter sp. NamB4 TaxID=2576837 RepID=UPI0014856F87|nr:amidohydrolase family protein [Pseudarthrobacter sp. NamB4]